MGLVREREGGGGVRDEGVRFSIRLKYGAAKTIITTATLWAVLYVCSHK